MKVLREALATKLAAALPTDLKGAEPWKPKTLGELPRAIILSLPSPLTARPGSLRVDHRLEIEVVLATRANVEAAMESLTPLAKKLIDALHRAVREGMATDHGVNLFVADYRQDEAVYGGQPYITLVIGLSLADVDSESFTP